MRFWFEDQESMDSKSQFMTKFDISRSKGEDGIYSIENYE